MLFKEGSPTHLLLSLAQCRLSKAPTDSFLRYQKVSSTFIWCTNRPSEINWSLPSQILGPPNIITEREEQSGLCAYWFQLPKSLNYERPALDNSSTTCTKFSVCIWGCSGGTGVSCCGREQVTVPISKDRGEGPWLRRSLNIPAAAALFIETHRTVRTECRAAEAGPSLSSGPFLLGAAHTTCLEVHWH